MTKSAIAEVNGQIYELRVLEAQGSVTRERQIEAPVLRFAVEGTLKAFPVDEVGWVARGDLLPIEGGE